MTPFLDFLRTSSSSGEPDHEATSHDLTDYLDACTCGAPDLRPHHTTLCGNHLNPTDNPPPHGDLSLTTGLTHINVDRYCRCGAPCCVNPTAGECICPDCACHHQAP